MFPIKCLTGLVFEARPWNLGDIEDLLGSTSEDSPPLPLLMLRLVAGKVLDPGPYLTLPVGEQVDLNKVSHSDITLANIAVRAATPPTTLELEPSCRFCGKGAGVKDVDLRDFTIIPYSQEALEALKTGKGIARQYVLDDLSQGPPRGSGRAKGKAKEKTKETTGESKGKGEGKGEGDIITVILRDILGADSIQMAKQQGAEPSRAIAIQTCVHIESLQVGSRTITGMHPLLQFWKTAPWSFQQQLDQDVDRLFGGVDTSMDFECVHCTRKQTTVLPLDMAFFGVDPEKRLRSRQSYSSGTGSTPPTTLGQFWT
ncbi:MAG: hypothetical protein FJ098_00575 [Deltaproteobacteria bacterium]|nr:hypothetical protein [Deltaproteobacteria bacterium]